MRALIAACAAYSVQAGKFEEFLAHSNQNPSNSNFTPIIVTIDGKEKTKYVASECCTSINYDYVCPMNCRGYIIEDKEFDIRHPNFFDVDLSGASVEFDVDNSEHDCGCFNTIYTVSMPGLDAAGKPDLIDGYYYCDANAVGGELCPEMDLMESNKYAFQTTPHACDDPDKLGHYAKCDGAGSAQNSVTVLGEKDYGPGSDYKIDTTKEFHVKIDFNNSTDGTFSGVITTISQGDKNVSMVNADKPYTKNMTEALKKQVFVISNWEGDDSWLRKDRCNSTCSGDPVQQIRNITITSGKGPSPPVPGPYDPADFTFGDPCDSKSDDLCGEVGCPSVDHCRFSWPNGSDWKDPNAHCRCDEIPTTVSASLGAETPTVA